MKTAKMCLWVFLPMIFITGASMEGRDAALFSSLENGGFVFKTNQVQLDQMEGKANFFYREASSSKGFHSIEIVFEDVLDHKGYKMGLTLKKETAQIRDLLVITRLTPKRWDSYLIIMELLAMLMFPF
ncbi:hypothetical protein Q2T40_04540 [Winogradskyella maritima]|nr:hypothetical protein [Winogradskyella maritima]